jgi:hypothetical protein
VLLRSLLSVIIIIVCFSILTGGIAVYARQETVLLDRIIKEINKNNDGQMKRINL